MPDLAATARLNKWLRAMVGYRLQYTRTGSGDFALRHRPYLGASARTDLGKMRVSARLLFTEQIRGLASDELRHGVRTKLGATWRGLDRVRPGASLEIFHTISDPDGNGGVELDPAIDPIIMKAVAKDKENRYPTAEAFGDALLGYLHHRGKASGPGEV